MFDKIKKASAASRIIEEKYYEQVVTELSNGQKRDGLWAKALANSDGSEDRAKSLYIGYRVQSIKDELNISGEGINQDTSKISYTNIKLSSRARKNILKTTAFILALLITFFIKIALMAAGLLDVTSDFMKTGVFLFLGLWNLFYGLLLKDSKKRGWGYGFLTVYLVGSIALGGYINNSNRNHSSDSISINNESLKKTNIVPAAAVETTKKANIEIKEVVKIEAKKTLSTSEKKIKFILESHQPGKNIQFTDASIDNDEVIIEYTLKRLNTGNYTQIVVDGIVDEVESNGCNIEDYLKIISYGKKIKISLHDMYDRPMGKFTLTKSKCKS